MSAHKERPILFSAPMVRALLEGQKTQTRRVVKPGRGQEGWLSAEVISKVVRWAPSKDSWWTMAVGPESRIVHCGHEMDGGHIGSVRCPYGQPGDRLWVRETFVYRHKHDRFYYRADHPIYDPYEHNGWKPSIHMPRRASRIALEITDVRVEPLSDISESDAKTEGAEWLNGDAELGALIGAGPSRREGFAQLWRSIYGDGSWAANPWVWVISFRRLNS